MGTAHKKCLRDALYPVNSLPISLMLWDDFQILRLNLTLFVLHKQKPMNLYKVLMLMVRIVGLLTLYTSPHLLRSGRCNNMITHCWMHFSFLTCSSHCKPLASEWGQLVFFWTTLVLAFFWPLPVAYRRFPSLKSALDFAWSKLFFCCISVLVCCCAAHQYSEIAHIFSKFLKNSVHSKG